MTDRYNGVAKSVEFNLAKFSVSSYLQTFNLKDTTFVTFVRRSLLRGR